MAESTDLVTLGSEVVRDPRVQQFMSQVVGGPATEAGAWFADEIRYRRWRRQLKSGPEESTHVPLQPSRDSGRFGSGVREDGRLNMNTAPTARHAERRG